MTYINEVLDYIKSKYSEQKEYIQAVEEVLETIEPLVEEHEEEYRKYAILERLVIPERLIEFRVPWTDDEGKGQVNVGYRVQFNSAIGPYKGGLRFDPSVNQSIIKFLGFEQGLKNSLTGLPLGGGKGGSDFNPRGKSDREIMDFCQSFVNELYKHVGANIDVPAGDIGVGAREIGYMFGQFKRLTNSYEGVFTGKGVSYGGSFARTEATGYGIMYLTREILRFNNIDLAGKIIGVSGAGNVAVHVIEKANQLGAKVVTAADIDGWIYDPDGISSEILKEITFKRRESIEEYVKYRKNAEYYQNDKKWHVKMDIAIPCATQNELGLEDVKALIDNGVMAIIEGANMPSTKEANEYIREHKDIIFVPSKAANAGGVATSGLEMTQNSMRLQWSFEEVDKKLEDIMKNIAINISKVAREYSYETDYQTGANLAGFIRLADAMMAQGIV